MAAKKEEGSALNAVRQWVQKVRRRLSDENDSSEQEVDWMREIAWLMNDRETNIGSVNGEEQERLLDSDCDERPFGPLQFAAGQKSSRRSGDNSPCRTSESPTLTEPKQWNRDSRGITSPQSQLSEYKSAKSEQSGSHETLSTLDLDDDEEDDDLSSLSSYDSLGNALGVIVESLSTKQRALTDFSQIFEPWRDKRTLTLHTLRSLADDLEHHRLNVNISVVTGSSVGATGGVLAIIGLALAPETFGVSLILTAVGTAASVAGGVTSLGSNIADCVITSKRVKVAQTAIDEDTVLTKEIHSIVKKLLKSTSRLQYVVQLLPSLSEAAPSESPTLTMEELRELQQVALPKSKLDSKPDPASLATSCVQVTAAEASAVGALEQGLVARAAIAAAEDSSIGISVAARAAGITFSALAVGLDIYKIVTTSMALAGGSESEAANKLRKIADELDKELERMTAFYDRICGDNFNDTQPIPDNPSEQPESLSWDHVDNPSVEKREETQSESFVSLPSFDDSKPLLSDEDEDDITLVEAADCKLFENDTRDTMSEKEEGASSVSSRRHSSLSEETLASKMNSQDKIQEFVDNTYRISY